MRPLTPRERTIVRLGAAFAVLYATVFFGARGLGRLEAIRADYESLSTTARGLSADVAADEARRLRFERLRKTTRIALEQLDEKTVVAQALAAIERTAQALQLQLVTLKEGPGRGAEREIAVVQLQAIGATEAAARFVRALGSLGFPLVVDRLELKTTGMQPGIVDLGLAVAVLDFVHWKEGRKRG